MLRLRESPLTNVCAGSASGGIWLPSTRTCAGRPMPADMRRSASISATRAMPESVARRMPSRSICATGTDSTA